MQTIKLNRRTRLDSGKTHGAFTLIEVLLVLVILVVLGAIVVPMVTGIGESASEKAAKVGVYSLERAIENYKATTMQNPSNLDDLVNEPSDAKAAKKWAGPYIPTNKDLIDPWDNPFKYDAKGKKNQDGYDVWSTGPDGQDGNADDIGNWKEEA
jgi:general secretion pathway protein G